MLEELKERNMELLEQIRQLKLKLQAFENDQLRKMFIELTTIPFLHFSLPPGPDQTKLKNSKQWRGSCRNFWRAMENGPDTLIRGPIKNTVYVFPDVVGSVKMLITFKRKSMGNGPYNIFRGFENAYKTCPHQ